jgi:hypothetical protein
MVMLPLLAIEVLIKAHVAVAIVVAMNAWALVLISVYPAREISI